MILEIALAALVSCDPALARQFTPLRPAAGHYEACTTPRGLDEAVAAAIVDGLTAGPPASIDALDAFGNVGLYDRGALNRLYSGRRPRVVRGWRVSGSTFESLTFISPYPDAELTKLINGTLVLRWQSEIQN